jgi:hypothetical protein
MTLCRFQISCRRLRKIGLSGADRDTTKGIMIEQNCSAAFRWESDFIFHLDIGH